MKPLSHYEAQLDGKKCKWCNNTVSLEDEPIEHYDHPGGYEVEGFKEKQWLYVVCPTCEYQWSLRKLGIKE